MNEGRTVTEKVHGLSLNGRHSNTMGENPPHVMIIRAWMGQGGASPSGQEE